MKKAVLNLWHVIKEAEKQHTLHDNIEPHCNPITNTHAKTLKIS